MFKRLSLSFLFLCIFGISVPAEAGLLSKAAKGYVVYKVGKSAAPVVSKAVSKKVLKNGVKDTSKPLLQKELKVGEYGRLKQSPESGLQYHHIPSTKQIEKYGIKKDDGIAIGMQGDRHSLTRTYKNGNKPILQNKETPRDALGRDIKDTKRIYEDNGKYSPEVRNALQDVVKQNKTKFPDLYKKP